MKHFSKYSFLVLLFVNHVLFGQDMSALTNKIWLQTIVNNAIAKHSFQDGIHKAPAGYALYFSKVDTLNVPYLVYIPKGYDSSHSCSLIVYLHGGVVSLDSFQFKNALFASGEPVFSIAEKYNAIVLYPFGRKDFGWVKQPAAFENVITEILNVEQIYHIDKNHIFLGGMSNGGSAAFWFITHYPQLFTAFYSLSGMPELYQTNINFENIKESKPLYSLNAKDDEGYSFAKVKAIYEQHKAEASGWHFDSVETGGHGFIYDDSGLTVINKLFDKLNQFALTRKAVYDSIRQVLFQVDEDDEKYRNEMDDIRERFGGKSEEIKNLFKDMRITDSLNLIIVEKIINKYGWLGSDEIGGQANKALFMVIQHNNLPVQEKYLPLLRYAVKNSKADAVDLALLEDRVALREGREQIYGSQLSWNLQKNTYTLLPIADPDNVDKRRAAVGLGSYADYLKGYDIKWDLEQYKKDLTEIERQFKLKK